jgi:hypothetical protein
VHVAYGRGGRPLGLTDSQKVGGDLINAGQFQDTGHARGILWLPLYSFSPLHRNTLGITSCCRHTTWQGGHGGRVQEDRSDRQAGEPSRLFVVGTQSRVLGMAQLSKERWCTPKLATEEDERLQWRQCLQDEDL